MKRLKLLLGILTMTVLLIGTVALFSPYAPVAAPAPENIEEIWAIEDARVESERPLVTHLENHGAPLAYDAASNTFFCTLGLGHEDAWPDIHLTAPGAEDVQLIFVDDYSYDWCQDAIRDGYPYQVMAYTDDAFWYFDLVFTGIVQVCIDTQEMLGKEDRPVEVTVSTAQGALKSSARAHYRGGVTVKFEKHPYKIEFTRTGDGRGKVARNVPTLGQMEQFILIPMWYDNDFLRDRLSWTIYGEMAGEDEPYGARRHTYAEVFVNDQYEGVYLLLEPFDHEQELAKAGAAHAESDWIYASCPAWSEEDRPTIQAQGNPPYRFAMHRQMQEGDPFGGIRDYIDICLEESDEIFMRRMLEQVASEFSPALREKNIAYELDLPPQLRAVCDPDKMARVFDNLLNNACHYAYPNSTLRVAGQQEGERIILTFNNAGRTIPPEKLERMFEQFFRLDSSRGTGSGNAGLGLAIAKEIVEAHGGTIHARSADEQVTFTVILPVGGKL